MSLTLRLIVGGSIFAVLAIVDIHRHGKAARRWREYLFLLAVTALAMVYGAINDLITSAISWEYFYYGKELSTVLGPRTPPVRGALAFQAMLVGIEATWTVGLLLGAALLMANNPRPMKPPLPFARLFGVMPNLVAITIACALMGGILGYAGLLDWCSEDFQMLTKANLFRPHNFMATWGVHLGGYVGGLIGGVLAVMRVSRLRRSSTVTNFPVKFA